MKRKYKIGFLLVNLVIAGILAHQTVYTTDYIIHAGMTEYPVWYTLFETFVFWLMGELIVYLALGFFVICILWLITCYKYGIN